MRAMYASPPAQLLLDVPLMLHTTHVEPEMSELVDLALIKREYGEERRYR